MIEESISQLPFGAEWAGVYDARRAAALSGVPVRTLSFWAQRGFLEPSVSKSRRPRLWSWADLVALRAAHWLRSTAANPEAPLATFREVRAAIRALDREGRPRSAMRDLLVGPNGSLYAEGADGVARPLAGGQPALSATFLRPIAPYGLAGPDLLEPRPLLRIVPGKIHGEPHVADTRVPTAALHALVSQGFADSQIAAMYPGLGLEAIRQALDLERSLATAA